MERLWAPWRHAYVSSASGPNPDDCIFCNTSQPGRDELILVRGRVSFVILNLYPYNTGHLMVVPNRHAPDLASMSVEEQAELMKLTRHAEIALTEAYTPHGLNMGINLGRPAGAGVLDHLHMHVVPRWNGDTNFISVVGETRVLPEELPATATRLRAAFSVLSQMDK